MIADVKALLANPFYAGLFIVAVSVFSLVFALIAEHVFGLEPCILCIYQRVPYVITIILGLAILLSAWKFNSNKAAALFTLLTGIVFLAGGALAFYHAGVEQHWWPSHLEGCRVDLAGFNAENLLAQIESTQAVRCDEIPWQMFGISMAGYNALLSFGLGIGSILSASLICKRA